MDGNKRKIVDNGVTKSARISQKRPMSRPAFAVLVGVTSLLLGKLGMVVQKTPVSIPEEAQHRPR